MNPLGKRKCSICHEPQPIFWSYQNKQKSFICDKCLQDAEKLKTHFEKLEKKRKYKKGERITSLDELVKQEFVYWNDKITHHGWFKSWQLRMTEDAIKRGIIYKAIKNESGEI